MGSLDRLALSSSAVAKGSPKSSNGNGPGPDIDTVSPTIRRSKPPLSPSSSIRRITNRKNGIMRDIKTIKVKQWLFGEDSDNSESKFKGKSKSRESSPLLCNGVLQRNHERRAKTKAVKRLSEQRKDRDSNLDLDTDEDEPGIGIRELRPRDSAPHPTPIPSPVHFISTKISVSKLERVFLSLISPLPNENAFGINSCLVMSLKMLDENRGSCPVAPDKDSFECLLQFKDYPQLLDALLAHSGVFRECALRNVFVDVGKGREMDYKQIWAEILKRAPQNVKRLQCDFYSRKPPVHEVLGIAYKKNVCCIPCICGGEETNDEDEEYSLFQGPPGLTRGIESYFEIACILKGASFSELNARIMASDLTLKRYILLAIHSSSAKLVESATIIMSNIAPYMKLHPPADEPMTAMLMNFVQDGLNSEDRFQVLYSLKIISALVSQNDASILSWNSVSANISQRFLELLLVDDLLLLITTLLCIHEVARCIPGSSDLFANRTGFISTLVRLLSYDVHDRGREAIIGMKLVQRQATVDAPIATQVSEPTPRPRGRPRKTRVVNSAHQSQSMPSMYHADNVIRKPEDPNLYEIWRMGGAYGPGLAVSCWVNKTEMSQTLYSITKMQIPIHLATLSALPGPDEYERQAHYKRLSVNDWIRLSVAHILKTLATNSWCTLDLLRTTYYLSLVDLQYLALEAGADYYDALRELVEILETEDRGSYNQVDV